jgi:hypothetical protein
MKQMTRIATMLVLLISCAAATAMAQTRPRVTADVPFEFGVGSKVMPAGKYTIQNLSGSSPLMVIRSEDAKHTICVNTQSATNSKESNRTKLVFRRYGSQYFLAQIWTRGDRDGTEFPASKAERRVRKHISNRNLAQNNTAPEQVTILVD